MSTTADIVRDLNDFLASVNDLLNTATAREAPNIARDLGAESQLNAALDLFGKGLGEMEAGVHLLGKQLTQADSAVAGFELLAAALVDFGEGAALLEVTRLFELPDAPFQPVCQGIAKGGVYLKAVLSLSDVLPDPGGLRDTQGQLQKLRSSLEQLKAKPALPAPSPSLPKSV